MDNEGKKYDLIAEAFAESRKTLYVEKTYLDLLLEHLPRHASFLDVGCGSGYPIASYLLKHGFSVTGIDASLTLLHYAKAHLPDMECFYGDMRNLNLSKRYDAIIAWDSFFHLPPEDQIYMISRFAYWLMPNGVLLFTTGEKEETHSRPMMGQTFRYHSLSPALYKSVLKANYFKLLANDKDQLGHLIWFAKHQRQPDEIFLFRPIAEDDFPLIHEWFNQEHVQQFYSLRTWSEEDIKNKFKSYLDSESNVKGYLIISRDRPIGYVQLYKVSDTSFATPALAKSKREATVGLDIIIGDPALLGKGLGSKIVAQFLEKRIWPEFDYCITDPQIENKAAIRCYEKAGFTLQQVIPSKNDLGETISLQVMLLAKT